MQTTAQPLRDYVGNEFEANNLTANATARVAWYEATSEWRVISQSGLPELSTLPLPDLIVTANTTIDLSGNNLLELQYRNVDIQAGATLNFSNPLNNGACNLL
ncbi:MAG: hypothetical protein HC798_03010 [Polaribacter sp.]|nr:hypothetical protein [Polaribacter sp.]